MKNTLLLALILCFVIGCSDSNHLMMPVGEAPLITGYVKTNANGIKMGTQGIVNERLVLDGVKISNVIPNPCIEQSSIFISVQEAVSIKAWVVQGKAGEKLNKFANLGMGAFISTDIQYSQIIMTSVLSPGANSIRIMLEKSGLFRLYVMLDNDPSKILWTDFYSLKRKNY